MRRLEKNSFVKTKNKLDISMHDKSVESFFSLFRLFYYMRPYRTRLIGALICSVLHNIFDILPDLLIGVAVDVVVNKHNSFLARVGIADFLAQLLFLGSATFILWSLESIFEYLSEVLWRNLAQAVQHDMRVAAYGHMQQLEMAYFENKSTGEILTVLNDDINQLEQFFDKGISDGIYFIVSVVCVSIIFIYLSPMIAFFAFFPVPMIIFIAYNFQNKLGPLYVHVREQAGLLGARIASNIHGIATIKSCTTEGYELERLRNESCAYKKCNSIAIGTSAAFVPVVRVAIACGFVITMTLGGWYVLHGTLAIGAYSVLVSMTQRLLWPFIYLAKITDVYKRAMACAQRVFAIIDLPIGIVDGQSADIKENVVGHIEFKNVSFMYPSGVHIFENLSLSIEPGQMVGFVGSTGSGKTTLIKLLLRFYDPIKGTIFLDGLDTKNLKLHALRRSFGIVSQDIFLFNGTIQENIMYGSSNATIEDVEHAAHMAEIHNFIMTLKHGYKTVIGEHGQRLSGGQKQRISIARALVSKAPILIFDEATSSVDNETEVAIQRSLQNIAHDHTLFVVAHRLSSVRHADNIFVLRNGVMVEMGKHDDLVVKNGMYAHLWHIQTGGSTIGKNCF
jgi:ATP-binding cassette subfamily B protein